MSLLLWLGQYRSEGNVPMIHVLEQTITSVDFDDVVHDTLHRETFDDTSLELALEQTAVAA